LLSAIWRFLALSGGFPPVCWQLSGGVLAAFWQRS